MIEKIPLAATAVAVALGLRLDGGAGADTITIGSDALADLVAGDNARATLEQVTGDLSRLDTRSDVYSLGVMLYELTTGILPFTGDDPLAVITQHLHAPAVPPRVHIDRAPRRHHHHRHARRHHHRGGTV